MDSNITTRDDCRDGVGFDHGEALRFLHLLGKNPASTWFRAIKHGKGANASRRGADLHGFDVHALADDCRSGHNLYAVIGDSTRASGKSGGVTNSDIEACPAIFAEWDDKPIEWQVTAWQELGLPEPSFVVATGGKSAHLYWVLEGPMAPAAWHSLQARLLNHCGADPSISNPARVMRLPGGPYIPKATGKPNGQAAAIVNESGRRYRPEELEASLQPIAEAAATAVPSAPSRDHPPRSIEEVREAATKIPRRVGGQGTYPSDRNALCGCAAALAEAGCPDPEAMALELLGDRWPNPKDAAQVLKSTTTRKAASFWAIARKHGYSLKRGDTKPTGGKAGKGAPQAAPCLPASFEALIQALPDGWRRDKNGTAHKSSLSAGQFADLLPAELLRFNEMYLLPEVHTGSGWLIIPESAQDSAYVLLDQKGWIIGVEPLRRAVIHVARQHPFHPVRDYLLSLEKNPTVQPFDLNTVAPRFFRASDPMHIEMVRKWLIGAVGRALKPGSKMDYCLVLQGNQGIRKSTAFEVLASKPFHCSSVPDQELRFLMNVHSCWILELAELETITGRREAGRLKNTLSTAQDWITPPYGKAVQRMARSSVFAGTVNKSEFLRDETGNRRFWVVPIAGADKLDLDSLAAARDGIWKAAVAAWRTGEKPMLSETHAKASEEQNAQFRQEDAWDDPVRMFLEKRQAEGTLPVSLPEVHEELGILQSQRNAQTMERIKAIAASLGWEKARKRVKGSDGKTVQKQGLWPYAPQCTPCTPPMHASEPLQGQGSKSLCTPFTPFLRKGIESREPEIVPMPPEQESFEPGGCTGWTEPETDCSTADLTTQGVGAQGCTQAPKPGDPVELQAEDGSWSGGYRLATVEETSIGTRARIEAGSDFRVVALERIRPAAPAPGADAA